MSIVVVELAGGPEAWSRAQLNRKTGAIFTPAHQRKYQDALRYAGQVAMGNKPPFAGAVAIVITATFPLPKAFSRVARATAIDGRRRPITRPDLDNVIKQVGDSLNQVVWADDKLITDVTAKKRYGERPALRIEVEAIDEPLFAAPRAPVSAPADQPMLGGV